MPNFIDVSLIQQICTKQFIYVTFLDTHNGQPELYVQLVISTWHGMARYRSWCIIGQISTRITLFHNRLLIPTCQDHLNNLRPTTWGSAFHLCFRFNTLQAHVLPICHSAQVDITWLDVLARMLIDGLRLTLGVTMGLHRHVLSRPPAWTKWQSFGYPKRTLYMPMWNQLFKTHTRKSSSNDTLWLWSDTVVGVRECVLSNDRCRACSSYTSPPTYPSFFSFSRSSTLWVSDN